MGVWKTSEEAWHESKWKSLVVVLVILFFLTLVGIMMLAVQGNVPVINLTSGTLFIIIGVIVVFFYLAPMSAAVKFAMAGLAGRFLSIVLVLAVIGLLITMLVAGINTWNILVVIMCIAAIIIFFPIAIFIVDIYSYEHE